MTLGATLPELDALRASAPLPCGWEIVETLLDAAEVPGLSVSLVGLLARTEDGREALGSAGAPGAPPCARAYFELFERIAVLEAMAERRAGYLSRSAAGDTETLAFSDVFPEAPASAPFRYSRSNGVAAGATWLDACTRAFAELVERDRLLRAWYGEGEPLQLTLGEDEALRALEPWYEFRGYSFPGSVNPGSGLAVAGLFGFPKSADAPLVFGSAAAATLPSALSGARRECLQRWGFLWGERIPSEAPSFAPTEHVGLGVLRAGPELESGGCQFVDLGLGAGPAVARALARAELPLTFGRGHPAVRTALPESLSVHPIA
jgi:hypothetical protein